MKSLAVLALTFAVGPLLRADDDSPLKPLEGTYSATAVSKGGKDVPEEFRKELGCMIAGDQLTFTVKGKEMPAKVAKIDAKAKPATIDLAPTDGPEKGKTFLGIYSYQDGELTLAFTEKGDRPTDFTGAHDATVVKLKKVAKKDKD